MNADEMVQRIDLILHAALTAGNGDENLVRPCRDLLDRGGKRWRPLFLLQCARLASCSAQKKGTENAVIERALRLTPLVEFAHTASLIHDDIEDSSDTRRNAPAIHITYGVDRALNAASWLYFQALHCLEEEAAKNACIYELFPVYCSYIRTLHQGQALDIAYHRDPGTFPSIEEYFSMVTMKTGTLASLAAVMGLTLGGADDAVIEKAALLAGRIGASFQILDDITNLTTGNPGKRRGDDIVEGKKSYPILLHLKARPEDAEKIAGHFAEARLDGISSPAIPACINMLQASGSLEQADFDARSSLEKNAVSFAALYPDTENKDRAEAAAAILALFKSLARPAPS